MVKSLKINKTFNIIINVILCALIFYAPYNKGLFFEGDFFFYSIILSSLLVLVCISWIINRVKLEIDSYIKIILLIIPVLYLISSIVAAELRLALLEAIKYFVAFMLFMLVSKSIKENARLKDSILWTIMISAVGVAIISFDNMSTEGISVILNKIAETLGYTGKFIYGVYAGDRIYSTFQYPNTSAVFFLIAFMISSAFYLKSKK